MKINRFLLTAVLSFYLFACGATALPPAGAESFGREIHPSEQSIVDNSDFVRREAMIPMRDGVELHTIVLVPKRDEKMPVLLTRTPYGIFLRPAPGQSRRLKDVLFGGDDIFADAGYIRVFQDVRGRNHSGGEYVVNRPLCGPLNPTDVDHSTDTYDTIQWLLENIPENNGRVGMIGGSYDGFLVLMGIVNPHPALKAAVPVNPMVDGWVGDDWFHNGAFRQMTIDFLNIHLVPSGERKKIWRESGDDYKVFLRELSAGAMGRRMGVDRLDFWKTLLGHPAYDEFWQGQAMDKILSVRPLAVPTYYVHGLWDQEDIYGAIAAYLATEPKDTNNDRNFLVVGPWNHGGSSGDGYALGPIRFNSATGPYFRRNFLLPFFDARLKDGAPDADIPPVLVFETGANRWRRYNTWPLSCASGCEHGTKPLYLQPGFGLDFIKAGSDGAAYDAYVSDPSRPVPYRKRPIKPVYSVGSTWGLWLVDDQRQFADRSDVLSYQTAVLTQPVRISGRPTATLFASTSGTDMDLIVKLIDVYPDRYPEKPELSGYQLMISADIIRGRYRKDPANPSPVTAGCVEQYRWELPAAAHVFLPGHRIMVQIQSSWFPLYDRNPQTYVDNIFNAVSGDFLKAEHRIYRSGDYASCVELPVVD
ncbi:MAG: CocE/NonD family hydrolase [Acidobacteria bacterium]|nr:CocE/NonD family hydrolase [Acidobacteriota bacterium]